MPRLADLLRRFSRASVRLLGLVVGLVSSGRSIAHAQNLFPGLGPPVPRLGFHTGKVVHNQAEISPILPALPGPPSDWTVSQWSQQSLMTGDAMTQNDPATRDPNFGLAAYAFTAPDGHSHVWIYRDKAHNRLVYDLYECGGRLSSTGGSNIFLSRKAPAGGIPLDYEVTYSIDAKLSKASVDAPAAAQADGAVLASVFTGFVIQFPEPNSPNISTIFLQIPFAGSQPRAHDFRFCTVNDGRRTTIFSGKQPGDPRLPFAADSAEPRPMVFSVTDYLKELASAPIPCIAKDGARSAWSVPDSVTSFKDWKITGIYIGPESENRDERSTSRNTSPQGSVKVGLQFSGLKVTRDLSRPVSR